MYKRFQIAAAKLTDKTIVLSKGFMKQGYG